MSVLIKDMEKPISCFEWVDGEPKHCPFVDENDDCVILREKGICTGTTWADMYSKCPLMEVLEPHGRLIDADAFDERVRIAGGMVEDDLTEDFKDGVLTTLEMLKTQPTVIEEEGEEWTI